MSFLAALNLGNVEAAPQPENGPIVNAPVGRGYIGRVSMAEYRVKADKRFQFALMIQLQVTQGPHTGKTSMIWTELGNEAHTAQGVNVPAHNVSEVAGYKPTMTPENLQYFKRDLLNLGVTNFDTFNPEQIKNLQVTWDVVDRNGYLNVYSLVKAADGSIPSGLPTLPQQNANPFPNAPVQQSVPSNDPWAGVMGATQPQAPQGGANMDPFQ